MKDIPVVLSPGRHAERTARLLAEGLPAQDMTATGDFAGAVRSAFLSGRPVVGLCAAGILIRILAPLLADKRTEPPVVAVSAEGAHAVPLLGGHRGANELAMRIAWLTGGAAAVTTASESRFHVALDDPPEGWKLSNPEDLKPFVAALLDGRSVRMEGDAPWLRRAALPISPDGPLRITVTTAPVRGGTDHLVYHPATVFVGIGASRGAPPEEVAALFAESLREAGVARDSVAAVGTISLKADEAAIDALARELGVPLRLFEAEELAEVDVPSPSPVVLGETGTPSVAEAAALLLAGAEGRLLLPKRKSANATCALAEAPAPRRKLPGGRRGRLSIVGLGPGDAGMRTPRATEALASASDWVGYGLYLDLAEDLAAGRELHRFPLGEEERRVRHALSLASEGRHVALLCSGDPAIYAMATLVFEVLDGPDVPDAARRVAVEVIPGISAFQSASAAAGALIGHDFCTISLSDLLTPWEVIEARIRAAAEGDFVVAFYNPRSRRRTWQLRRALSILRGARPDTTPAVVASNLGRPGEKVLVMPLAEVDPELVDMLSIVMVGNSESRMRRSGDGVWRAWTPRGYAGKREKKR